MARRQLPDSFIIPVETLNREFDGKLLLALSAAARGLKPILGGRTQVNAALAALPPSLYLGKGIRTGNRAVFSILEKLGHIVVALDEEALLPWPDAAMMAMYDAPTFNRPRLLFAWGRSNADLWRRYAGYGGAPILEVGNPRADMLRPEVRPYYAPQAEAYAQRFGAYALLSSNFSLVNHFIPDHVRFRTAAGAANAATGAIKADTVERKRALFEAFRKAVPHLARALQPAALVIRPHPSEDPATWSKAAAGLDTVHVVHEGPIAPWLMGARVLLHNGCTTAMEAAQLDTPALAYCPLASDQAAESVPNRLSRICGTEAELADAAAQACAEPAGAFALDAGRRRELGLHIASLQGPLSVERILAAFTGQRAALESAPAAGLAGRLSGHAANAARNAARAVRSRIKSSRTSGAYLSHKFPGISEREVNARIARLRAVLPHLPEVKARELKPSIFAIGP